MPSVLAQSESVRPGRNLVRQLHPTRDSVSCEFQGNCWDVIDDISLLILRIDESTRVCDCFERMLERRPLAGRVIAVPETRELEKLTAMLEERGATALRYPLVRIVDAPDRMGVMAWLRDFAAGAFDDLILMTGEGLSRLLAFARRAGLDREVIKALGEVRTITRGSKTSRALREIGCLPHIMVELPTTEGIIDALGDQDFAGHTVGLQLAGQQPNERLAHYLTGTGALVRAVAPYMYEPGIDHERVLELIGRLADGSVDTIAFTNSAQVERLFAAAQAVGKQDLLRSGLSRSRIATIGPVAAKALRQRGFRIDIVPTSSFFMRTLVNEIVFALRRPRHFRDSQPAAARILRAVRRRERDDSR